MANNNDVAYERRYACDDCKKVYLVYQTVDQKCLYCGSENVRGPVFTGRTIKKDELEEHIERRHMDLPNMQPVPYAIIINNFQKSREEQEYYDWKRKEIAERHNREYQELMNSPNITKMPSGVPYKSSEYYMYHSYKNEGYGCLIVVLCLLALLCGQWYTIPLILIVYYGMISKNNEDLANSPNTQEERKKAKQAREKEAQYPQYSPEFIEKERKRLGL